MRKSHPDNGWREIAKRFRINNDTISRRSKSKKFRIASGRHNTKLTKEEEKGLLETIDQYTFISIPLCLDLVCQVANRITQRQKDRYKEEK